MKRFDLVRKSVLASLTAGLCLSVVGCKPSDEALAGHGHSHGPGVDPHGDDHEEPAFAMTVWEKGFEVFAEHPAAETGESAEFIVHVTELATGLPRIEGPLTLTLTSTGGDSVVTTVDQPARPGIYLPSLKMPGVGILGLKASFRHNGAPVEVNLGAVTVYANHDAAHQGAAKIIAPEGISYLKEQQWRSPTRIELVGRRARAGYRRCAWADDTRDSLECRDADFDGARFSCSELLSLWPWVFRCSARQTKPGFLC